MYTKGQIVTIPGFYAVDPKTRKVTDKLRELIVLEPGDERGIGATFAPTEPDLSNATHTAVILS